MQINPSTDVVQVAAVINTMTTTNVNWYQIGGPPISPNVRRSQHLWITRHSACNRQRASHAGAHARVSLTRRTRPQNFYWVNIVLLDNRTETTLVIRNGTLAPGEEYRFRVNASDAANNLNTAWADLFIVVSSAPRGLNGETGDVAASPSFGDALLTTFTLSTTNWADVDGPLQYRWEMVADGKPPLVVVPYQLQPAARVVLPAPKTQPVRLKLCATCLEAPRSPYALCALLQMT